MDSFESARQDQLDEVGRRVKDRVERRRRNVSVLKEEGGIARADDPDRVATRIDRLSRYYADVRPISPAGIAAGDATAMRAATAVLERVINTADFLGVRYLEGGVMAARSVGRVNMREPNGRIIGYGSGSLVSPHLLLTNRHVLPDTQAAASSTIEFDFQDGLDGRPLEPRVFSLDPDRFFMANEELDFALVAVRASAQDDLNRFGFNRLIADEGKAIVGDFVSIIQHPLGQMKQVALRENRIVDVLDLFLHYETDTEPGSSGSPVFNDQWELVALHHASVPAPDQTELGGIVNEGIRVSRLVRFVSEQHLPSAGAALVAELSGETPASPAVVPVERTAAAPRTPAVGSEPLGLTIPLEISLRAGDIGIRAARQVQREAVTIDPDYINREGYDPEFLGTGAHNVPLPVLKGALAPLAAINNLATAEPAYVLPYHHFSIVLNKERGLAFFTAVNIDGTTSFRLKRETDRWSLDPRVPDDEQTGEDVYFDNPLDRGHLVRRLDPAWGLTSADAKVCNDDTFHFTNCSPQHKDFNQFQTLWAGLEDYILDNADNLNFRVSVFSGPVFAADDDAYRDVQLPRQFWKIVAMVKEDGTLSATGYLLSQEELIRGLEVLPEAFSYGAYRTYQVPIAQIETITQLSFGAHLSDADPLAKLEAATAGREVSRADELVL
jgi:endonuclease G